MNVIHKDKLTLVLFNKKAKDLKKEAHNIHIFVLDGVLVNYFDRAKAILENLGFEQVGEEFARYDRNKRIMVIAKFDKVHGININDIEWRKKFFEKFENCEFSDLDKIHQKGVKLLSKVKENKNTVVVIARRKSTKLNEVLKLVNELGVEIDVLVLKRSERYESFYFVKTEFIKDVLGGEVFAIYDSDLKDCIDFANGYLAVDEKNIENSPNVKILKVVYHHPEITFDIPTMNFMISKKIINILHLLGKIFDKDIVKVFNNPSLLEKKFTKFEEYIKIECSNIQFPTTVRYMFNIELVENTYSILNYLMTILYFFKYTYTPFHFPDYKHFNDVVRDFLKIEKEYIVKFERYGTYWFIPLRRNRINKLFLDILKIGSVSQPTIDLFLT